MQTSASIISEVKRIYNKGRAYMCMRVLYFLSFSKKIAYLKKMQFAGEKA